MEISEFLPEIPERGSAEVAVPEKQQTLRAGGFVILSYAAVHVTELRG